MTTHGTLEYHHLFTTRCWNWGQVARHYPGYNQAKPGRPSTAPACRCHVHATSFISSQFAVLARGEVAGLPTSPQLHTPAHPIAHSDPRSSSPFPSRRSLVVFGFSEPRRMTIIAAVYPTYTFSMSESTSQKASTSNRRDMEKCSTTRADWSPFVLCLDKQFIRSFFFALARRLSQSYPVASWHAHIVRRPYNQPPGKGSEWPRIDVPRNVPDD